MAGLADSSRNGNIQWILVRGLTREAGHWGGFSEQLLQAFPGSQIATLDLPGAGIHHRAEAPLNISEYVEPLRRELGERGPVRRYLITLSMAAMAALEWMKLQPDYFEGAVLINGSAGSVSPFYRRLRPGAYPLVLKGILGQRIALKERALLDLTSNREDARVRAHPSWVEIARARPVSLRNAVRQLMAAGRFRPPHFTPQPKLLFLTSTRDRMVHHSCTKELHKKFGGEFHLHDAAGHDLPLDAPDWVIERIRSWITN